MTGILVSVEDLLGTIAGADRTALDAGAIDPDAVWYVYHTQDDDRVRPSHAALEGTVWRVGDPHAPVPPLDYGCRCYSTMCAPEDSPLAKKLPAPPADEEITTAAAHYADYLDGAVPSWSTQWAKKWSKLPSKDQLNVIWNDLKAKGIDSTTAKQYATMIIDAGRAHAG